MNFKAEQERFDVIKWYDSIVAGEDRCGSYDFCGGCDKTETEPCARAAYRLNAKEEWAAEAPPTEEPVAELIQEEKLPGEEKPKALQPILTVRLRVKKK